MASNQRESTTKKATQELRQKAFLASLVDCAGHIANAASASGIDRTTHYLWLKIDPEYPARFEEAMSNASQVLEDEARRRAVHGTEKPVFYLGAECGRIREYSDTLLIFLMKGAMPDKYREKHDHKHSGQVALPVSVSLQDVMNALDSEPKADGG